MRRFAIVLSALVLAGCNSGGTYRSTGAPPAAPSYAQPSRPAGATYAPAPASYPAAASMPAGAPRFDAQNPTMQEALAGARAAGKPLVVFLLASWCGFCRKLEAGALQDGSVHAAMANAYCVRVDPDSANGRAFASYARSGYPTVAVFDASGAEKANWPGNRPGPDLAMKLNSIR